MSSMKRLVMGVLAYHINREESAIRVSDRLYEDLGLTTLGLALVILEIEDVARIRLAPDRLDGLVTVGDLVSTFTAAERGRTGTVARALLPQRRCSSPSS